MLRRQSDRAPPRGRTRCGVFTLAFYEDPTWSWAFPDPGGASSPPDLVGLYVHSALPYGWVWVTEDGGAASPRFHQASPELNPEDEARSGLYSAGCSVPMRERGHLARSLRFLHPTGEPHYYLALLGAIQTTAGKAGAWGCWTRTSRASMSWDSQPTSSRPTRPIRRYERLSFVQVGEFALPGASRRSPACGAIRSERERLVRWRGGFEGLRPRFILPPSTI